MKATAALVFVVVAYLAVGTADFNDQQGLAAERERGRPDVRTSEPAQIWSKRCERQGKDVLAVQADGGRWEIRCIPRRVLTVKS